jgi:predicted ribosomally synthesized peptide with nif11-like leader
MAKNTGDSASQLVDRLVNDAQFRESLEAAPTLHAKAQVLKAAGYGDVSLDGIQEAFKQQLAAVGAGVQVDPARVKRVEELFRKTATDNELQQALQAAATPEAKRDVLVQAGYGDITLDDLKAAAADLAQREELSDAELEAVSGGADQWSFDGPVILGSIATGTLIGAAFGGIGAPVGMGIGAVVGYSTALIANIPAVSDW